MKPITTRFLALAMALVTVLGAWGSKYQYQTVPGDPLNTQMYTLPNGLKIFMTVNKDTPRIQTYIAVRVGGKNDPAETTGLAHYFEHLMFKGTEQFGTQDYAAEKPLLDKIENLFETYRHTTDSVERRKIYREIDSISYQASLIAIPNEYDKLMAAIGAEGTNAFTSYDVTCYVEDIPSNQVENWAKIQADRFEHPILRGFHTELETIYEEKNMSLTQDGRKMAEAMLTALFPNHPYGTQTVLGTQENLKNPSITNVKNYHKQWYVPNNMAIALSGDFDPDQMVDIISKYFGHLKPNPNLPVLQVKEEAPITKPIEVEVLGPESERLYLAWRLPKASDPDMLAIHVLSEVLSNGQCGIIDLNLNQTQKVLGAGAGEYSMADGGGYLLIGMPNPGQSLDEVRALLLEQMAALRAGNFSDDLVPAIINNMKLDVQKGLEKNGTRANYYVDAFVNGQEWSEAVKDFADIDKITKADIVAVANKYFGDNNFAAIYKRQGDDKNIVKMPKPELTPIATNRDKASEFLLEIQNSKVDPIEPVFLDFSKDLTILNAKQNIPVYYTHNKSNDLSDLIYVFEVGTGDDKRLSLAADYLDLLGTADMTAEDLKKEFYNLACNYRVVPGTERSFVVISGLSENLPKAAALFEKFIAEAQPDAEAYARLVDQIGQTRINNKANQNVNFGRLRSYMLYGPKNPSNQVYSEAELKALDPQEIINAVRDLMGYEQRAIYYGNMAEADVLKLINDGHKTPATLKPAPTAEPYKLVQPTETVIYIAPYEAKQLMMAQYANRGTTFNPELTPALTIYNEYFGGSMNAIVFQEMRESRSLAYSAYALESSPSKYDKPYFYYAYIATQNDKMMDAVEAFDDIINNMPESQGSLDLAKQSTEARMRSARTIKDEIAWAYIGAKDLGLDTDPNKAVFEALPGIDMADVVKFQQDNVKGNTYIYGILGDPNDIDLNALKKIGRVVMLTPEDIFGY